MKQDMVRNKQGAAALERVWKMLCVRFTPNSGYTARYAPFIRRKSPKNWGTHLLQILLCLKGSVLCGGFPRWIRRQFPGWLHTDSFILQRTFLLYLRMTRLPLCQSGKLSGYTSIPRCTNFCGIISAYPIRCTPNLRQGWPSAPHNLQNFSGCGHVPWFFQYPAVRPRMRTGTDKFLWYHFSISYTLHITANRYLYLQCPKNMK